MATPSIHDARTGFHDIESIVFFNDIGGVSLTAITLAVAVLIAGYFLWRWLAQPKIVLLPTALEQALATFERLSLIANPQKPELSEASLSFRSYLASQLNAPCEEMTVPELKGSLRELIASRAPQFRPTEVEEFAIEIVTLLKEIETAIFAPESTFSEDFFRESCREIVNLIKRLDSSFSRHDQQQLSIISQSRISS